MISRSFLLVLLVLACLQFFTTANTGDGPDLCCFRFQTRPIPVKVITDYEVTDPKCTKPGVIFTLQGGHRMCADLQDKWVKHHMKILDQRLFNHLNKPEVLDGTDQCCTNFVTQPIPVSVITVYEETDPECLNPGVIFTLQDGGHVCTNPQDMWVKIYMNTTDQHLFNNLNKPEVVDGPDQCCTKFLTQTIPVRIITKYEETDPECLKPGVIFTLQNGFHVCADPQDMWVKNNMNKIDQRLFNSLNKHEVVDGPDQCCTDFLKQPIPVRVITTYEETYSECLKHGVIFTLQNGLHVCVDPKDKCVKNHMNRIDQRLLNSLKKYIVVDGPDQCCTKFLKQQIPVSVITEYEETDPECLKPGVIFTLQDGRHVCADPKDKWVKNCMNRIDQSLFNSLNNTEVVDGPDQCCTKFQTQPIPVRFITAYKVTDIRCEKPGVIFTLQNGRRVCAYPGFKWVKNHMKRIDQHLFKSLNNTEVVDGPDQCCTKFLTQRIPVRVITVYEVTDPKCTKPGVIFTLQNGLHVCADPQDMWVKIQMNKIDQRLFNSLNKHELSSHGPALCCVRFQRQRIPVRFITAYEVTDIWCLKPGVIFTLQNGLHVCADPTESLNHLYY